MFLHFHYTYKSSFYERKKRILSNIYFLAWPNSILTQVDFSLKKNQKTTSYKLLAKLILTNVLI